MKRAHLFISGRVQGIFYRATCLDEARSRSLEGWVRNLPDGRVEALLQGPKDRVESMIKWCYRGPSEARVSDIDVTYEDTGDDLGDFEIH